VQHTFRGGVSPLHPVRSTAKNPQLRHGSPDHQKLTPHRARITTLPSPDRRRNRDRIGQLNRSGSGSESALLHPQNQERIGTRRRQGRARDRRGQHGQLKKKLTPEPARPALSQVVSDRQHPVGHDEDRTGNEDHGQHKPGHRLQANGKSL
jgi:hypothetical protein